MHDRIADPWGERTPYARGEPWPVRVDEGGDTAGADAWARTASVLHSNGDGYDVAVRDGRIVGVRGRARARAAGAASASTRPASSSSRSTTRWA